MQIAVVALAPGQCGFYDDLSGIHLSLTNKEAKIMKGVNTSGLVNAVQIGKIIVVSGSLGLETFAYEEAITAIPTYYRLLEKKKKKILKQKTVKPAMIRELVEEKIIPVQVEEEVKEEKIEEIKEISIEIEKKEEVENTAPKKKARKKKEQATKEEE